MDQYIGKMLDNRYEILERIGTGGMAVVYKAKCHYLNRLVAVKILKSDLAQDEDFRRRFNAESQAVAQLSHPNIVSVYDVSKGGDTEYIVMELIDGITLKQYMEKRGQLNWREALHFITQIMRALSHAHSRGVIHRDIKPQNIMVLRDGSVKVADFGIACLENSAQTLTQEALGSVHYISPEQARGDRTDARSDIYSAGVVLYEMLTSRLPFEGESAVSVAIQHLSSIPLAPREVNPDVPKPLELICMKAMAPDLDKRYASADEMIADLESFRKNPGVNLDFSMDDLRPDEEDEPTQLLRTPHMAQSGPAPKHPYKERPAQDEFRQQRPAGKKKRHLGLLIGGLAAAAVLIILLYNGIFGSFGSANSEHTVPNVIGYTVEEAGELPEIKGIFEINETKEEPSDQYPKGTIIDQDPKKDKVLKTNLVINVTVSSGESTAEMIDVIGDDARDAQRKIKDLMDEYKLDLTIDNSEENQQFSDDVDNGCVISTEPAEGEKLKDGDTIKLIVSKGPENKPITIPNFKDMNVDEATKQASTTYKLKVNIEKVANAAAAGTVIGQSLAVNSEAREGDTITFTVSDGTGGDTTISQTYDLPTDRDTVAVVVKVNGKVQYNETVSTSLGSLQVSLTGSGTCNIVVSFDGVVYKQYDQSFE
ncbi:MAG: Stk1 family PASTA domain-containing Ser/Thr kinase [Oscillibacter sp.]|jgi:serine/threonine-protein kinase|nr:Stk1 family PASTA domain-containing Ser/Thr kinase [Oscillibacter sp.]